MADIAIVCGAGIISGKEIMVLELIDGLRDQGLTVDVVNSSWGTSEFRRRCENLGISVCAMRLGFISASLKWNNLRMTTHQMFYWPKLLISYRSFLKRSRPGKVIHTTWHHLLLLVPFLRPERDLFWLHEVIPNKWQYRMFFRILEHRLRCFAAVSHAVAESLRKIDIQEGKITVVHNGIADPTCGAPAGTFSKQKLVVGIVGQVGAWKGHEDLLKAFAMISPTLPNVELHIFGKGSADYENHLRQRAISLGVADKVSWRGFVADRFEVYRDIDLLVVPSRCTEGFGLTAVEAAFFRIPTLAATQGGLPEIVEDGRTGFLFEAGQPTELASRLKILLGDDRLRLEMGDNARRRARERFNLKRFTDDFLSLLEADK
jgi:glycosyltransferase involved in cell wall biosynthesis